MNRVRHIPATLICLLGFFCANASAAGGSPWEGVKIEAPCSAEEKWSFSAEDPKTQAVVAQYQSFLKGGLLPARALADASELSKKADSEAFGEFWIGRIFLEAGLPGISSEQWNHAFSLGPKQGQTSVEIAALECLEQLEGRYPSFHLSPEAAAHLPSYFSARGAVAPLLEAALSRLVSQLGAGITPDPVLSKELLKGGGNLAAYFEALKATKARRPADAIKALKDLVAAPTLPVALRSQRNAMRILLARNYYATGQYPQAVTQLDRIDPQSNERVIAQSDLAWAAMRAGDSPRALGVEMGLRTGPLKDAFAPEPSIVAAMIYNESCLFPEAMAAIKHLRGVYGPSLDWLNRYSARPVSQRPQLYPMAAAFLKDKDAGVPARIASEWVHSPAFLANQQRLSLSLKEPAQAAAWQQASAAHEDLGSTEPDQLRLSAGLDFFQGVTTKYLKRLLSVRAHHETLIEDELQKINSRLRHQLQDIDDNTRLIEIEVLNGAAKDILARQSRRRTDPSGSGRTLASQPGILDWGVTLPKANGAEETWPDETQLLVEVRYSCSKQKGEDL